MKLPKKTKLKMYQTLEMCGQIANVAVHLTSSTTLLGKAGAAMGFANAVFTGPVDLADTFSDSPLLSMPASVSVGLFRCLLKHGQLEAGETHKRETVWELRHGELRVMFVHKGGGGDSESITGPWYKGGNADEASQLIGRHVWEGLGPQIQVRTVGRWGDEIEFTSDELVTTEPSKLSETLAERTQKLVAAGHNRGILLHGPPGTGKSYIIRDIARRMGNYSVRHKCVSFTEGFLPAVAKILKPRTVLLDDIDRGMTGSILDAMEELKQSCSAVLATANYTDHLDPALRRPGRFDEHVHVEVLDDAAFSRVVGTAPDGHRAVLRDLPIAYVHEYVRIRDTLGLSAAAARLFDLKKLSGEIAEAKPRHPSGVEVSNKEEVGPSA